MIPAGTGFDGPRFEGPRYDGNSLVNLVAELETRLTGQAPFPALDPASSAAIPERATYVLMVFDGLGSHQLSHPAARDLARVEVGSIDALFPSTTTVSLSSIATGLPPAQHGVIGHHMWVPDVGRVVNVLKWILPGGAPVSYDTESLLPAPNLWERLTAHGVEAITVQPGAFEFSPLSKALYRGCRIEPAWTEDDLAAVTIDLAQQPGRLIFTYVPHVDVAAHLYGQSSEHYANALRQVTSVWERIAHHLPEHAVLVGTADHGHADYQTHDKYPIESRAAEGLTFFGDPRSLYVRGAPERAEALAATLPARWLPLDEIRAWWGPGPAHAELAARSPAGVLLADRGNILLPSNMDARLVGYHGGLEPDELSIPLLVH